jgi:hypothetical protein
LGGFLHFRAMRAWPARTKRRFAAAGRYQAGIVEDASFRPAAAGFPGISFQK